MNRRIVGLLAFLLVVAFAWPAEAQIITKVVRRNPDGNSGDTEPAIAPSPLAEKALGFVDRDHVYVTVPQILLGCEYVMTANDDRDNPNHEMDVTVSTAATLYLFIDNRVGTGTGNSPNTNPNLAGMAWVTALGFVDTGLNMAFDEANDGDIDQWFSIFAVNVKAGTITFEAQNVGTYNMYAVAAVSRAPATAASDPVPEDGERYVPRDVQLGWKPGEGTSTRDVYLGMNPVDVNNATVANPLGMLVSPKQSATTYQPAPPLVYGQKYYWRIDEVNAVSAQVTRGEVWSFTVEPLAYLIENVTATASSSASTSTVPAHAVDQSGLTEVADGQYVHGTAAETMWQSAMTGLPATIAFEFDQPYKLHEMKIWNHNTVNEGFMGLGAREVTIEVADSNAGPWTPLTDVTLNKAPGQLNATATDTIPMNGVVTSNVRLTIRSNQTAMMPAAGLAEVQFFYIPVAPREMTPADGAVLTDPDVTLAWRSGREAAQHKVYLAPSADIALVQESDPAVLAATVTAQGSYASYAATGLNLSQAYVWKIAEVNTVATPSTHNSPIFSFTLPDYELVDDMEGYKDEPFKEIWATWLDGTDFGTKDPTNASTVGADPAAGDYGAAAGRPLSTQSLPIWFNNTAAAPKSEAIRTFPSWDWTAHGIKSLSLWFSGVPGNTGQLYVKINNSKVLYSGDAADIQKEQWLPFNIDLSNVAGGVSNVTKLAVGVEGAGAKGVIYIDDIRLYPIAPQSVTPADPGVAGLAARYTLDGNVNDSSGHNYNGTANGGPTYGVGNSGQAIQLDGVDDHVVVTTVGISGAAPRTISGWAKADRVDITEWTNVFGFTGAGSAGQHFDIEAVGTAASTTLGYYGLHRYGWEQNILPIDLEWHHLAATYDGARARWYGDGLPTGSAAVAPAGFNPPGPVHIGKRQDNSNFFPGMVDEVRIYNRALSDGEIAWLAGKRTPVAKPF